MCYYIHVFYNIYQPFSIYIIYPFHAFQISGKLESTLGQKLTTLSAPAPTELQFSINFFSLICSQPRDKQNCARDFFFSLLKYFLNNLLLNVFLQNTLSKLNALLH